MTAVLLRRRKLGKTSTEAIADNMKDAVVIRNWLYDPWPERISFVFRWGCSSNLPRKLNTINKSGAIHLVNNKKEFRRVLQEHNTDLIPLTRFDINSWRADTDWDTKCVVRPSTHAQGREFFVCENHEETAETTENLGGDYYISELVEKESEYRVFVGSGRCVWVAQKTPDNPEAIAWNVARGGRFDNVRWGSWNLDVVKTAIEAFNLSGLDFGGVDVMVDKLGKPYILEINSAPSQTSPYRQQCVGKYFQWIVDNGRDHIPTDNENGYRSLIHPAVLQ